MLEQLRQIRLDYESKSSLAVFANPAEIDDEVTALFGIVSLLRGRRNQFAAVSRLPPEILAAVFCFCMPVDFYTIGLNRYPRFTDVCRSWRQVALQSPDIWTHIHCGNVQLAEIYLQRSKKAPIYVFLPLNVASTTLQRVFSESDRMRELEITLAVGGRHLQLPYDVVLSRPAPLLEKACFYGSSSTGKGQLPANLFGLHAPRLHNLRLRHIAFDWSILLNPSITSRLRHLDIINTPQSEIKPPSWANLLDSLDSMHFLEVLKLRQRAIPWDTTEVTSARTSRVVLDRLTWLELEGTTCSVAELLRWLSVPAGLKLDLSLNGLSEDLRDLSPITTLLSSYAGVDGAEPPSPLRRLYTTHNEITYISSQTKFQLYTTDINDHNAPLVNLSVTVPGQMRLLEPSNMVEAIIRALPLADVQTLHLNEFSTSKDTFARLFGDAKQVKTLLVREISAKAVIQALTPPKKKNNKGRKAGGSAEGPAKLVARLFPRLQELSFDEVDFESHEPDGVFAVLKKCLQRRRGLKVDISYGSDIGDDQITALKKIAGANAITWDSHVHWAGETDEDDSEEGDGWEDSDGVWHSYSDYSDGYY